MSQFKRILVKISGDALREGTTGMFHLPSIHRVVKQIVEVAKEGIQEAVVIGGGNILRGSELGRILELDEDDLKAWGHMDLCGMVATYINGRVLKTVMKRPPFNVDPRLMVSLPFGPIGEPNYLDVADHHLEEGKIVIFLGGTGKGGVTTDTAAVLSARDVGAEMVFKATKVGGIFSRDPLQDSGTDTEPPEHYPYMTYRQFIEHQPPLGIMDTTAVTLAEANRLRIRVFNVFAEHALLDAVLGKGKYSEIGPSVHKLSSPYYVGLDLDVPTSDESRWIDEGGATSPFDE